jgi:acetolactate synthase-1/2/3 large subunit
MFATSQGIKIRESQRLIFSAAQSEMGFTLPASVGVAFAKQAEVIGICGDGSLQMNIQELQTVKHHNIPVKLFVWNNDGYSTIRQTQAKFFKDNHIGTDSSCGVSFPNLEKIADAYGIFYVKIPNSDYLELALNTVLQREGPVVCEVMCDRNQVIQPVISSKQLPNGKLVSCPSEDMYPFLPRQEFFREMIVKPEKSSDE